ncbi:MAG: S8 family serine peptidase, partial [Candidatus Cloacimonadota bacterium]|nr:S8 family serine peptidase [Candidatus Cloacimonadota bacterium]
MKKNIVLLGFILIAISVHSMDFAPNEIIVKTRYRMSVEENSFGNDDIDEFLETKGNFEVESIGEINSRKLYLISFEEISVLSVVNEMKQFVEFEYIQPNYLRDYLVIPNDPELSEQYSYFTDINLFDAWNKTSGSENILISIIDSGIYLQHPDITKNIWVNQGEVNHIFIDEFDTNENGKFDLPEIFNYLQEQDLDYNEDGNFDQEDVLAESSPFIDNIDNDGNGYTDDIFGWDFTDAPTMGDVAVGDYLERDNNPTDESSHGTHVAGIVGATTNNGIGIAGICWDISLMAIRSGHRTTLGGQLQDDDIAASIIYSTNMGADVINASWGEYSESQIISDAIDYAFENDVIMVCSSGNTGGPGVLFPANLSNTIAVGSVGEFKTRSSFSSYGNEIDVMAPGSFVHSTIYNEENGYTYGAMSGTSMAAPHICGVIGLLLSQDPTLDFREIKYSIAESAEDINIEGFDIETGYGLINAGDLLNNENSSQIEISYPSDFSGESGTFEIIGTVKSELFSRYTVMYTDKENPTSADWSDVSSPHNNTPTFYFEQKENEKLAE